MTQPETPVVLVVEDERDLADLYTVWLSESYTVRTAYTCEQALAELDEEVAVALLDRRLPDGTGDTVLEAIRTRDCSCQVAMVTAVQPDFDILDMGFDGYLTKPVTKDDLHEVVERLLHRATYTDQMQEYHALVEKRLLLEAEKSQSDLEQNEEYATLVHRIEDLEDELDTTLSQMLDSEVSDEEFWTAVLRDDVERAAEVS